MKKFLKKFIPLTVLTVLCAFAIAFGACAKEDVVFKGTTVAMGAFQADITLTLKGDNTAELDFNFPTLKEDTFQQTAFDSKGTWSLKDNVYTVVLGEGDAAKTYTSTYDETTKKHTIAYSLTGNETTINATLEQQ